MSSGVVVLIAILLLSLTGASITYRNFTQQLFGIEKDSQVTMQPIKLEKSWASWITGAYQVMPEESTLEEIRFPRVRGNANKVDTAVNERPKEKSNSKSTAKTKVKSTAGSNIKNVDIGIEFNFQHQGNWFEITRSKAYITQRKSELVDVILYSDLPVFYVMILLVFSLIGTMIALSGVVSFAI